MEDYLRQLDGFVKNQPINPNILTDEECEIIVMGFIKFRGAKGYQPEEIQLLLKWCETMRIGEAMVALAIDGLAEIDMDENGAPLFRIKPEVTIFKDEGDSNGLVN